MDRVRKSSIGDIPVLMPDGKPSRRRGAGPRAFRWLLWLLLVVAAAGAGYLVRARRAARAPAQRALPAAADSLRAAADSTARTTGGTRRRPDSSRSRPPQ